MVKVICFIHLSRLTNFADWNSILIYGPCERHRVCYDMTKKSFSCIYKVKFINVFSSWPVWNINQWPLIRKQATNKFFYFSFKSHAKVFISFSRNYFISDFEKLWLDAWLVLKLNILILFLDYIRMSILISYYPYGYKHLFVVIGPDLEWVQNWPVKDLLVLYRCMCAYTIIIIKCHWIPCIYHALSSNKVKSLKDLTSINYWKLSFRINHLSGVHNITFRERYIVIQNISIVQRSLL